jgi:BACON domain-containing protein
MAPRHLCVALFSAFAVLYVSAPAAQRPARSDSTPAVFEQRRGHKHTLVAEPFERDFLYGIENLRPKLTAAKTATITVTYTGFTPEAQAAFQAAVNVWESIITSSVPIRVDASFAPLGTNILGQAGATFICRNFPGAVQTNTWYPAALADKLRGTDGCATGSSADIEAEFSSNFPNWSYDVSGGPIGANYSFLTVVLHELGHGLGFFGSAFESGGVGQWGQISGGVLSPYIWDRFVENGAGQSMIDPAVFTNPSAALANFFVSGNVFFDGPQTRANNGTNTGKLEATLNPFQPGSSFSHVDDTLYTGTPNALMTYALAQNERVFDPGPIVKGMFTDMGWTTTNTNCNYALARNSVNVGLGSGTGSVGVITTTGCAWTATSNSPGFLAVTGTTPSPGTGIGSVTFTWTALASGSRSGTITIAGNTFTVFQGQLPTMSLTPTSLNMAAVNNGAGTLLSQTPPQTLRLLQSGAGSVSWTATASQTWLTISPSFGTGAANLSLSINNTGNVLPPSGQRTATVTITTTGATNNPTATVNLTVLLNGTTTPPTGVVDTPTQNQGGITGSLPVTGWGVDDVGVTALRICRQPIPGESAPVNGNCNNQPQIFIGNANFVNGARPDIAATFPNNPQKDSAGWGYLLLTNFLPNQGNGTFTLTFYLQSADGQTTGLGSRTIVCTNSTATNPFGAIDTPDQGGTASGNAFINFGWVLAGQPTGRFIPTDGSTIQVFIDSAPVGGLNSYNNPRSDIQTLFPGYQNTNGAVGFRALDTTAIANGVHTIAWVAADNLGAASGIGSRFFTVANSNLVANGKTADAQTDLIDASTPFIGSAAAVNGLRHNESAVAVRHGYAAGALPELAMPDANGVRHVRTAQLERIAIDLRSATDDDPATYRGYTLDGGMLRGLPVGSSLNQASGEFAWAPGVAFGGTHDLVFVRTSARGAEQIRVRVAIDAKPTIEGEPRLVIDMPAAGATVSGRFTVAGWSIDASGPANSSGIDTLHVWAYPIGQRKADPIWVGVAAYGGARSDVGDLFGPRFARSGYSVDASLPPGTYDVVVYAHSVASDSFRIARTVRVTVQ